jgi:hypothetical protein
MNSRENAMSDPATLLSLQFLTWLATAPRTYGDVKQAWRSTCPRLTPWEDALDEGLIRFENAGARVSDSAAVVLTAQGRALLDGAASAG